MSEPAPSTAWAVGSTWSQREIPLVSTKAPRTARARSSGVTGFTPDLTTDPMSGQIHKNLGILPDVRWNSKILRKDLSQRCGWWERIPRFLGDLEFLVGSSACYTGHPRLPRCTHQRPKMDGVTHSTRLCDVFLIKIPVSAPQASCSTNAPCRMGKPSTIRGTAENAWARRAQAGGCVLVCVNGYCTCVHK